MNKHSIVAVVVGLAFVIGAYAVTQPTHAPDMMLEEKVVAFQGRLSPIEFQKKITEEEVVVLDVRTPEEYETGHLTTDAVNINFYDADFRQKLDALDRDVPYAVYCRSGARSGKTVEMMKELGFTNFYELKGGIIAWEREGLPVVSGESLEDMSSNEGVSYDTGTVGDVVPIVPPNVPPKEEPVFCTADAMQCPDGSYVGRTGPNCEFVCP